MSDDNTYKHIKDVHAYWTIPLFKRMCDDYAIKHNIENPIPPRLSRLNDKPVIPADKKSRCIHLLEETNELALCESCSGTVRLKVFSCEIHGKCTLEKRVASVKGFCDDLCPNKEFARRVTAAPQPITPPVACRWIYGVTTISERQQYLNQTLISLQGAGFDNPIIFVDTEPKLGVVGRWILSLHELYLRNPRANRYAIFQDDIVCSRDIRQYIESRWPNDKAYLNLFTFMDNEDMVQNAGEGWMESGLADRRCQFQTGRGACGLVFNREGVMTLLTSPRLVMKSISALPSRKVDGAIVDAMNHAGFREYIHNPSLIQHVGLESSIGNSEVWKDMLPARTFRGEEFSCLDLLG